MAKVVAFDPAKLPAPTTTAPKFDEELLAAYRQTMDSGKAAGDGEGYATVKLARAAANSVKRGLRKQGAPSTRIRTWTNKDGAFQFALTWNEVPLTGSAAAAAAAKNASS